MTTTSAFAPVVVVDDELDELFDELHAASPNVATATNPNEAHDHRRFIARS